MEWTKNNITLFPFLGLNKNGEFNLIGQPNSKQAGDLYTQKMREKPLDSNNRILYFNQK